MRVLLLLCCTLPIVMTSSCIFSLQSIDLNLDTQSQMLTKLRSSQKSSHLSWHETMDPDIKDPRMLCAANHGTFNWDHKRCYFLLEQDLVAIGFEEQVVLCASKHAVLSYPRNAEEVSFLWLFFEGRRGDVLDLRFMSNISIPLGLRKIPCFVRSCSYQSVDLKFTVDENANWFIAPAPIDAMISRDIVNFEGSNVCVTKFQLIEECDSDEFNYAVCSIDISL